MGQKYVRVVGRAGNSVNFRGITGDTYRYIWLDEGLIEELIEKGHRVYEKILPSNEDNTGSETTKTESTELLLTLENYNTENGGEVLSSDTVVSVVSNLEKERYERLKAIEEQNLLEIGKAIQKKTV